MIRRIQEYHSVDNPTFYFVTDSDGKMIAKVWDKTIAQILVEAYDSYQYDDYPSSSERMEGI